MTSKGKEVAHPLGATLAEIRKTARGAVMTVSGVVSLTEVSDLRISLASHSGRISVVGSSLLISVFEGRTVEICGKIEGVELLYAKT